VYRFAGNDTHTDYFRLVVHDGNNLLVGGRNLVHNLSVVDLTEIQVSYRIPSLAANEELGGEG